MLRSIKTPRVNGFFSNGRPLSGCSYMERGSIKSLMWLREVTTQTLLGNIKVYEQIYIFLLLYSCTQNKPSKQRVLHHVFVKFFVYNLFSTADDLAGKNLWFFRFLLSLSNNSALYMKMFLTHALKILNFVVILALLLCHRWFSLSNAGQLFSSFYVARASYLIRYPGIYIFSSHRSRFCLLCIVLSFLGCIASYDFEVITKIHHSNKIKNIDIKIKFRMSS